MVTHVTKSRLPAVYPWREAADAGGLMPPGGVLRPMSGCPDRLRKATARRERDAEIRALLEAVLKRPMERRSFLVSSGSPVVAKAQQPGKAESRVGRAATMRNSRATGRPNRARRSADDV